MGEPVALDYPRAVDADRGGKLLYGEIVEDLVVSSLSEGRVERRDRVKSSPGEPRRERHCVLLGDADVKESVGELFLEAGQPRAVLHCGGDGAYPIVLFRHAAEGFAKNGGERSARRLQRSAVLF